MGGLSLGWLGLAPKSWNKKASNFFMGTPEKRENVSLLTDRQQGLHDQLMNSLNQQGAEGSFGNIADYYRNLLSDDSADYNSFSAPMLRQYNEDIVPGLSEQFAGMGSGGLSSSGFRNAQIQGATDLSERLGALRSGLRQQGIQGLQNLGTLGLQPISQNMVTQPGTQGFISSVAPVVGNAIGSFLGGKLGNMFGGSAVGAKSSPYGGSGITSSQASSIPNSINRGIF